MTEDELLAFRNAVKVVEEFYDVIVRELNRLMSERDSIAKEVERLKDRLGRCMADNPGWSS